MASFKFIFHPSTRGDEYKGSIRLRVIHRSKIKVVTVPYKVYPHEWDKKACKPVLDNHSLKRNVYLSGMEGWIRKVSSRMEEIIETLESEGSYSVGDILDQLVIKIDISNLSGLSEKLAKDLIRSGQERTAEAYRTVSRGLIRFNKGKDIPLKHINANLIKNFERDMKAKGKSLNTISYYMRNLRAIYNKAIRDKQIEAKAVNPFSDVFTGFKKTRKRALSLDELKQLDRLDFLRLTRDKSQGIIPDACLSKAWRIFFFCFYARGMNFVDMAYLRKENIRGGVISYYRKKTGQLIEIKLTPVLQELIDSFSRDVKFSPYVFPVITDPDKPARRQYQSALRLQNIYLKKLCKLAGVKSKVTTHVTRHSWATIAKEENLPIWVISEGLGHSNEKMTYTYLASFDRSVLDQASEIVNEALQHSCSKIA